MTVAAVSKVLGLIREGAPKGAWSADGRSGGEHERLSHVKAADNDQAGWLPPDPIPAGPVAKGLPAPQHENEICVASRI